MAIGITTAVGSHVVKIEGFGIFFDNGVLGRSQLKFRVEPGDMLRKKTPLLSTSRWVNDPIAFDLTRCGPYSLISAKRWDRLGFNWTYEDIIMSTSMLSTARVPNYWAEPVALGITEEVVLPRDLLAPLINIRLSPPDLDARIGGCSWDLEFAVSDKFPDEVCMLSVEALLQHGMIIRRGGVTAFFGQEKGLEVNGVKMVLTPDGLNP
jgi:hypothetical protein